MSIYKQGLFSGGITVCNISTFTLVNHKIDKIQNLIF
jgi:hypothetical protein